MDEGRRRRRYNWSIVGLAVIGVPLVAFLGYLVTLGILNLIYLIFG